MHSAYNFLKRCSYSSIAEIRYFADYLKTRYSRADVVIQGSYKTGNVGDLAIGKTIKEVIERNFRLKCDLTGFYYSRQNFSNYFLHIIGGGGIIHDFAKNNLERRLNPIGTASKSVVLGVGVPGIRTQKGKKLIKKLEKTELITVRDEISKDKLQSLIDKEVFVTACPTFLMEPEEKTIKFDEETCGLSLRDWFSPILTSNGKWEHIHKGYIPSFVDNNKQKKNYLNFLEKNLKKLEKSYKLIFIPFHPDDIVFIKYYFPKINLKIVPIKSPIDTLNLIKNLDKMICMRYHSLIFSLIAEVPLFLIDYEDKTNQIAKKFNLNSININEIKSDDEISFFESKNKIRKIKNEMRNKAKRNFVLLAEKVLHQESSQMKNN